MKISSWLLLTEVKKVIWLLLILEGFPKTGMIQEVLAIRVFWGKGKTVNYKIRELQGILKSAQNRIFLMIFSLKNVNCEDSP